MSARATAQRGGPARPAAPRPAGPDEPARRQVQVDLPLQLWRQFQIQLVVDNTGPQQWISAQVRRFLSTPRERRQSVPYGRVPRNGPTRQVGARIPIEQFRAFRVALVEVGKPPVSWWLFLQIQDYAGSTRLPDVIPDIRPATSDGA